MWRLEWHMKFSSRMREIVPAAIAGDLPLFLSLPSPDAKTRWDFAGVLFWLWAAVAFRLEGDTRIPEKMGAGIGLREIHDLFGLGLGLSIFRECFV